jgi:hypothetical protein
MSALFRGPGALTRLRGVALVTLPYELYFLSPDLFEPASTGRPAEPGLFTRDHGIPTFGLYAEIDTLLFTYCELRLLQYLYPAIQDFPSWL